MMRLQPIFSVVERFKFNLRVAFSQLWRMFYDLQSRPIGLFCPRFYRLNIKKNLLRRQRRLDNIVRLDQYKGAITAAHQTLCAVCLYAIYVIDIVMKFLTAVFIR